MSLVASSAWGDEGMWLFTDLPHQILRERYDFEPTESWAQHLRLASVRFNSGGSGSFVSSDGLVLTNHHVASDTLHKLSSSDRNLIETGFLARSTEEELKAPDLELNQLVSIEDVTEAVLEAVDENASAEEAAAARRAVIAQIEARSLKETSLRSDVVTLFGGATYHLYRYKKYTDVRLVWAPETKAAFFGGDADNFEYPRYCLDATLMRVYEKGRPAQLEHFLRWSDRPVQKDELVFVSGNPGRTQRIFTVAALKFLRDKRLPHVLNVLRRKEILLQQYALEGEEQKRRGRDELFGIRNARKAYSGMLSGLQNPATVLAKEKQEINGLSKLRKDPQYRDLGDAWDEVADIQKEKAKGLSKITRFQSHLYSIANHLVLMSAEDNKPNDQRLREYTDASRDSLLQGLLSTAPIYDDLERFKLADELARYVEALGGDDPMVEKVLQGTSPQERANDLVAKTQLGNVAFRKHLADGGRATVLESADPMVQLALVLEAEYRRVRAQQEALGEREKQAYANITKATHLFSDTGTYPDATFTLRLAFGTVKGYQQNGQSIEPATDYAGAYQHADSHAGQEDFDLPKSWMDAKAKVALETQLNFVCTADIIGGNSGSPVVDREGNLIGLIFDGNIQSLTSDYLYSDVQSRAVSVSSGGILEALRVIYQAPELADALGN